jgi:hypothetical protein
VGVKLDLSHQEKDVIAGCLRRIFGPKSDEVVGGWRRLHNEFNDLYTSPDILRVIKSARIRWVGYAARMGESRNAYRTFISKPEGKRPVGRSRHRLKDIRMYLKERRSEGVYWMGLAQDRDQWGWGVVMNFVVP